MSNSNTRSESEIAHSIMQNVSPPMNVKLSRSEGVVRAQVWELPDGHNY